MSLFILILSILGVIGGVWLVYEEFRRDLMMLQQNSYMNKRYSKWLKDSADSTSVPRLIALVIFFLCLWGKLGFVGLIFLVLFCLWRAFQLHQTKYKHALVVTKRVRRLYGVLLVLTLIAPAILIITNPTEEVVYWVAIALLATYVASHMFIYIANILLAPVEKSINRGFYNDAARILRSMPDLKVIGITGSYGKTSTKHYLTRILSEKYDTLMTPGSYNTTLGVIRTIREMMKPYTEVFVCEMGAKNIGDIKEICDLVHPQIGIVTAVGPQHLESFKTIENVQRTKFELVDSLPKDGLAILNNDFPYVANRKVDNVKAIRYGVTNTEDVQYEAKEITYTPTGTKFTIVGPDEFSITLETHLVGECNISNLTAAVICAISLGVEPDKIKYTVSKIEQVEHRLNVKHTPGGVTIIDDAFNSNPDGSRMALDVLSQFNQGKRIVITPGMIELGDKQFELNKALGHKITQCADIAIVVGKYNRDAILSGLVEGAMDEERVHSVDTFNEAQALLTTLVRPGDTVLYENDLPDTFH